MSQPKTRRPAALRPRPQRLRGLAKPAQLALTAMAGVLLVYAQAVAALGVGEPRYLSHLFEPLRVDIPVDTVGVDPAQVEVGVAVTGVDAATAASVGRRLQKEWRVDERGGHVLRVTAPQAVNEPMLQLKVQVGDNRISTERDLTLMFDPAPMPGIDSTTAIAAVEPAAAAESVLAAPVEALEAAPALAAVAELTDRLPAVTAETVPPAAVEAEAADVLRAIEAELEAEIAATAVAEPEAAPVVEPTKTAVAAAVAVAPIAPLPRAAAPALSSKRIASAKPATVTPPASIARPAVAPAPTVTAARRPVAPSPVAAAPAPVAPPVPVVVASPQPTLSVTRGSALASVAVAPISSLLPAPVVGTERPLTAAERQALVASTLEPRALSAIDRWQRVRVVEGDTLEQLAARVRGEHENIPLPMVAMLLRWLNPRSFEHAIGKPLPGAELRFPKAESLAAQIAVSGGVWTIADVTAEPGTDAAAVVPPPSFQLLTALSVESMDRALQAATGDDADRDTAAGAAIAALGTGLATVGRPSLTVAGNPALRLSGGLVGGAAIAGVLSMLLMLNMVVRTPTPAPGLSLTGSAAVRQPVMAARAANVLSADALDLASLDLGRAAAEAVRQRRDGGSERTDA